MRISEAEAALLKRIRGLRRGLHTIHVVKTTSGKHGVEAWAVTEEKLETPPGRKERENGR
jgi:hypothetical protein